MGNLYWSSLANSFMDYYWFNLMKCNRFRCGVTVLWPKCYTLGVKLGTIDITYKYSTITGTGIVHGDIGKKYFNYVKSIFGYTLNLTIARGDTVTPLPSGHNLGQNMSMEGWYRQQGECPATVNRLISLFTSYLVPDRHYSGLIMEIFQYFMLNIAFNALATSLKSE